MWHLIRIICFHSTFASCGFRCTIWLNSAHTKQVDVELNRTIPMISGAMKSTPACWLPVLNDIPPPHLRKQHALIRENLKIQNIPLLLINSLTDHVNINKPRTRGHQLLQPETYNIATLRNCSVFLKSLSVATWPKDMVEL